MKKFLEITQKIAFFFSMIAAACIENESIIFPIILFLSLSWFLIVNKLIGEDEE